MGINRGQGRKNSSYLGVNKGGKIAGRRNMNQMMIWKEISQGKQRDSFFFCLCSFFFNSS